MEKLLTPDEFSEIRTVVDKWFDGCAYVKIQSNIKDAAIQGPIDIYPIKVWVSILVRGENCQMNTMGPDSECFWSGDIPKGVTTSDGLKRWARRMLLLALNANDKTS